MSHYIEALRAAQASDLSALLLPLLILTGFTAGMLAVAVIIFRWDPDSSLFRFQRA